jgi:hypothetical protein
MDLMHETEAQMDLRIFLQVLVLHYAAQTDTALC